MKFYGHYFKDELLDEYSVNDKAQNSSDADYRTIAMLYAIIAIVLAPFTQLFWSMVEWNDLFVTEQGVVFWLFVLFSCVQIAAICYALIHSIRSLKAAEPYSGKAVAALLISLLLGYFWFEILYNQLP